MESLYQVCVSTITFPPEEFQFDTTGSPNVYFSNGYSTGIKDEKTTGLSIYPNPTNDLLSIETNKPGQQTHN